MGCSQTSFETDRDGSAGTGANAGTSAGVAGSGGGAGSAVGGSSSGGIGIIGSSGGGGGGGESAGDGGGGPVSDVPSCQSTNSACHEESCCEAARVSGCSACSFPAGSTSSVADFMLDKYEVTVARFRNFVDAYAGPPAADAGARPSLAGSGWQIEWDTAIAADKSDLQNDLLLRPCQTLTNRTYTEEAGANEHKPMNCVTWYEAFAFCVWDGGYLPTEIEWQYAAAGGDENRTYPWGSGVSTDEALYGYCGNGVSNDCTVASIADVGSKPAGAGKWGHLDLAGSMWEWALDVHADAFPPESPCDNCANLGSSGARVIRGGSWYEDTSYLTNAKRLSDPPESTWHNVGLRCAR